MSENKTPDDINHLEPVTVKNPDLQQKISTDKLNILYENLLISVPASLICTTIVFISLYQDKITVLAWYIAVIVLSVLRIASLYLYQHHLCPTRMQWPVFVLGAFFSAALWSACGLFLMPADNLIQEMVVIIIIAGITAGSVQTFTPNFSINAMFIIGTIVPLSIRMFLNNDMNNMDHISLVLSLIIYLMFMLVIARRGHNTLDKLINLRYENSNLIDNLVVNNAMLIESEKRFHSAFDFAAIGMALVSLDGHWLKVNESLCQITGYSQEELLQIDFQKITYPDDLETDLQHVKQLLAGEITTYQMEKRYIKKNGDIVWILLSASLLRDANNNPLYFISQIQNIDARKRAEQELIYLAYHDHLTGLASRKKLKVSFETALTYAKRYNKKIALLFMDLDHFKQINDTLGHDIGDLLLIETASRLKTCVRATDILTRLGGDEFLIVLTEISTKEEVVDIVKKIIKTISMPMTIKQHTISITGSIGISLYPDNAQELETLVKQADTALYLVKSTEKNNFRFHRAQDIL